jgi:hypothetical protein
VIVHRGVCVLCSLTLDEEGSLGKVEHIFRVIERKCQPANLLEVICTTHTPTKSEA